MKKSVASVIAAFGTAAKQKLTNVTASGEPEDQLRAPFEDLLGEMACRVGAAAGGGAGEDL